MKKILILTAGFGEGHNAAARGIREGLAQVAPAETDVELHDLFAESYGALNEVARKSYLGVINRAPHAWAAFYNWLHRKKSFAGDFRFLFALKKRLAELIARMQPDVIVSVYPVYPYFLDEILGPANAGACKRIVVVTDSITVNSIWYQCSTDLFLVANNQTAQVMRVAGVPPEKIKALGFPVSPKFAALNSVPKPEPDSALRILYMINAGKAIAPELTRRLAELPQTALTVTVGRDKKLRAAVEKVHAVASRKFEIVGWTEDMPALLHSSHLLVGKAGGATVQETIAAGCPMIISQVVPGQEEGNAQLIVETGSGAIAPSPDKVIVEAQRAMANKERLWREWFTNIRQLGRPNASLDIARFILSL